MRCLITGAEGFIGGRLTHELVEDGHDVVASILRPGPHSGPLDGATVVQCDVRIAEGVARLVKESRPDVIYHLAAQSSPVRSWISPSETLSTNVLGTVNVLEAIRAASMSSRVFIACSSAEYGYSSRKNQPLGEDDNLAPVHPYGLSKVGQDFLGLQYHRCYGLHTIRGRIFNTIGPRKMIDAPSDFARQIVAAEHGLRSEIDVGNIDTIRDFCDVRDMTRAIRLIVDKGAPGEVYNLCSGRQIRVADVLADMTQRASVTIRLHHDPNLDRPSDEPWIVGDNSKFRAAVQWSPQIPIRETTASILDYWRGAQR